MSRSPLSVIPAKAGTQIQPQQFELNLRVELYDLGPGLRRDERGV